VTVRNVIRYPMSSRFQARMLPSHSLVKTDEEVNVTA
jgi:hypothetical protein